jgi:hypothetical protein
MAHAIAVNALTCVTEIHQHHLSGERPAMTSPPVSSPDRSGGRLFLLSGLGLAVLGVAAYAVQLASGRLVLPWYMPVLALIGGMLVAYSLSKRRTVWRWLALVSVVLLAGFELTALLALRLPRYTGPVVAGRPLPAFEARRADGSRFTRDDLAGDRDHALVFFRGRW